MSADFRFNSYKWRDRPNSLKSRWLSMSILIKIILVNIAVFVLLRILAIVAAFSGNGEIIKAGFNAVQLPASFVALATHPWTILTYMFVQYDLLHLIFNMLWLYWFGTIFLTVNPSRRLLPVYLYGGLAGALVFLFVGPITGSDGLIGASASVIAIVTATAMMVPNYSVQLFLIGNVRLKWVAIITVAIDILSLGGIETGSHISHLGGAIAGVVYVILRKHSKLLTKSTPASEKISGAPVDTIDAILDKIKRSGYTSLTPQERARLFEASRENQDNKNR